MDQLLVSLGAGLLLLFHLPQLRLLFWSQQVLHPYYQTQLVPLDSPLQVEDHIQVCNRGIFVNSRFVQKSKHRLHGLLKIPFEAGEFGSRSLQGGLDLVTLVRCQL